jgi:enoyl-CoA hydratase/carnithine racemase
MTMDYQDILFEVQDGVAEVTLNRPDRLNAYTAVMGRELGDAFRRCHERDDVRAVIVTGAGRGFCAGADLEGGGRIFAGGPRDDAPDSPAGCPPWRVAKPIIGAINGPAVGVGATLPLQWDVRIAAESARIGFVFVRRGMTPEAISTWTLPRLIGMSRAAELLYTGRVLDAREALAYGIVSRVVADAELLPTVRELAREIAAETAPVAVALTKRLLWHMAGEASPEAAHALDTKVFHWTTQQPDAREGIRAFLEKRPARWTMRPSADLPELERFR